MDSEIIEILAKVTKLTDEEEQEMESVIEEKNKEINE